MKQVILFVNSLSTGGAERVVSNLSLYLPVEIKKKIAIFNNKIEYEYSGDIVIFEKRKNNKKSNKLINFLKRYNKIKSLKKRNPFTPTISFLEHPNLLNLLTHKYGRTYVSVRNFMSAKYKKGMKSIFWNLIIKNMYKKADKIIAVSEGIKKDLINNYKISQYKIDVIHNFYPIQEISSKGNEEIEGKYNEIFSNPTIITVGRLNKQKGQIHLIRAFKEVKKYCDDVQLVILGEGEMYEELYNLACHLNVINDVHFLSFQQNPFKYITKSSVFTLTSYYEGFPNVLAEAMACGVPVISTDCHSGPREILTPEEVDLEYIDYSDNSNRFGILTPTFNEYINPYTGLIDKNEQKLIDALKMILKDNAKHNLYSQKSLERIKHFDTERIIEKWNKYCE